MGQNFSSALHARLFVLALCTSHIAAQARQFPAQVVAVHDGDTITVRSATETLKVRVAGVDCPEIGQPWSSRAKQFTSQLVFGKTVTIEIHGTDQYGRMSLSGRSSRALWWASPAHWGSRA